MGGMWHSIWLLFRGPYFIKRYILRHYSVAGSSLSSACRWQSLTLIKLGRRNKESTSAPLALRISFYSHALCSCHSVVANPRLCLPIPHSSYAHHDSFSYINYLFTIHPCWLFSSLAGHILPVRLSSRFTCCTLISRFQKRSTVELSWGPERRKNQKPKETSKGRCSKWWQLISQLYIPVCRLAFPSSRHFFKTYYRWATIEKTNAHAFRTHMQGWHHCQEFNSQFGVNHSFFPA